MAESVVVVEDERTLRFNIVRYLTQQGHDVESFESAEAFLAAPKRDYDVALIDLNLSGKDGLSLVADLHLTSPDTIILMMTAYSSVESVIEALRMGVQDYLLKPVMLEEIARKVATLCEHKRLLRENARLRMKLAEKREPSLAIVRSRVMVDLMDFVRQIANSNSTVLIQGESGSGKEVVARTLHEASGRHDGPFLAVNVNAIPEGLIESHLFGHERGAFTGADAAREGLFRAASTGTLFLDEIGELPAPHQVKLLRSLETKEVFPVGSDKPIRTDTRIVVATNLDLTGLVKAGRFRSDLYYRLSAIQLKVPPLRERLDDIPVLAKHFLDRHAKEHGRPIVGLDTTSLHHLLTHQWPGNVRELSNVIERATVVCAGRVITAADLPPEVTGQSRPEEGSYHDAMDNFERAMLASTLERTAGDRREAARALGLSLATLYRRIEKLGLKGERDEDAQAPNG